MIESARTNPPQQHRQVSYLRGISCTVGTLTAEPEELEKVTIWVGAYWTIISLHKDKCSRRKKLFQTRVGREPELQAFKEWVYYLPYMVWGRVRHHLQAYRKFYFLYATNPCKDWHHSLIVYRVEVTNQSISYTLVAAGSFQADFTVKV